MRSLETRCPVATESPEMRLKRRCRCFGALTGAALLLAGCGAPDLSRDRPAAVSAVYLPEAAAMAGIDALPGYSLSVPRGAEPADGRPAESGVFRIAWNEEFITVAGELRDSDLVDQGRRDQEQHYQTGDVFEVFLKPATDTYYWEFYATPAALQSAFFFPGRGHLALPECYAERGLKIVVRANRDGTLNQWRDRDRSWRAVMRIPTAALQQYGAAVGPGAEWRLLVARYNYSRYLPRPELSSFPRLPRPDFHLYEAYAVLRFAPPPDGAPRR